MWVCLVAEISTERERVSERVRERERKGGGGVLRSVEE